MDTQEPFNPLSKKNLGESVTDALLARPVVPLPPIEPFEGAGIYAIYYTGAFQPYVSIAEKNRNGKFRQPIYVGKAVPPGSRKGGLGFDAPTGKVLHQRLREHAKSIEKASNLKLEDFWCRYLAVDDVWIPLGESLLIEMFRPLWNQVADGFGNHPAGSGRGKQKISQWDILHPGRAWTESLSPGHSSDKIIEAIKQHLKSK